MFWAICRLVLVVLFVIALFIFAPIILIWSVNALFATAIPFTLKTWAAMLFIAGSVKANRSSK